MGTGRGKRVRSIDLGGAGGGRESRWADGTGGPSGSDLLIQGALMREGSQAGSWGGRGAIPPNTDLPVSGACLKAHSE